MNFYFYHLDSNPFIEDSSNHLFWSDSYQTVWNGVLERIAARQGIIGVLGQPGLGKSTILRLYRASVDPKYVHVIDSIDATQSQEDLLASFAQACHLTLSECSSETLFSMIYEHCQHRHTSDRQTVLLIDDAHTLSTTALGHVHDLFERLHHEGEPLLQIVLCGSPMLRQRCQHPDLYRFEQALTAALTLSPLAMNDCIAYIQHYLRSAATRASRIFSKGALKLIANYSQGIPKIINITCSDVLVAGLLAGEKPISIATVRSVIGDDAWHRSPMVRWSLVSAAALLLVGSLWYVLPTMPQISFRDMWTTVSQVLPASLQSATQTITVSSADQDTVAPPLETERTMQALRQRQKLNNRVNPAAFVPASPEPSPTQFPKNAEALSPLGNNRPDHLRSASRPSQLTAARPALIATSNASLLCAMPRTNGQRGSDIVLLGPTRDRIHRLIDDGARNLSPVLSPDGTYLAYTSHRNGLHNIYLRHLASGQETQLTSGPWLALPGTWSPNGRYLSFSQSVNGNSDIFIYDMVQQRSRRLTRHKGIDVTPSFAPDSQRLVFSSDRTGSPQLYITNTAGRSPVRLTRIGTYNTSPSWSPRDDIIAFVGRDQKKALDLYTIKPDGTGRRRLTQGERFHTPPAWLPDGYTLMGMSLRGTVWQRHLVQLNPDQAMPTLPQPESLCLAPQWVAYRAP